jgi:hypothetical protein
MIVRGYSLDFIKNIFFYKKSNTRTMHLQIIKTIFNIKVIESIPFCSFLPFMFLDNEKIISASHFSKERASYH